MNKNIVTGVIVVIVLLLGITLLSRNNKMASTSESTNTPSVSATVTPSLTPASTAEASPAPIITVEYTSEGFSPRTITVNKGETVRFVNKTENRMSVASDPHPTHTIYPEFDQYKTSARGQATFNFTFEKIGTWNYHNHAQASHIGTVIVK